MSNEPIPASVASSVEYTVSFVVKGTPAGKRRFQRMFTGEPIYRYAGGPPLIHKGKKP